MTARAGWIVACALLAAQAAGALAIGGVVRLEPGGAPAAGARVWLLQEGAARSVSADAEGRFVFDDAATGPFEAVALLDGHAMDGAMGFAAADAALGLALGPAGALTVKISGAGAAAVPGARLRSMMVSDRFMVSADALADAGFPALRADDAGTLAVSNLPRDGFVKAVIAHHEYADSLVSYLPVGGTPQRIVLAPGVRLAGRVLDPKGGGVDDAWATVFQAGPQGQRDAALLRTDPEGFFTARLAPGEYGVAVRHARYAAPAPASVAVEEGAGEVPLTVRLVEPRRLRGRILLPGGAPCPGARLAFRAEATVLADGWSGADGRFDLRLPQGAGVLAVLPPDGLMLDQLQGIPVAMQDAKQADLGDLRLAELPVFAGIVLDPEGRPVPRALVSTPGIETPFWALTDAEGRFDIRLSSRPEGDAFEVAAEHPDAFLRAAASVPFGRAGAIELRLKPFEPGLGARALEDNTNDLSALVGKKAPEWKASDWFNTQPLAPKDLRGKVVALLFWGGFVDTVEAYNAIELFRALHAMYAGADDVAFVSIHDAVSTADEVAEYVRERGIAFAAARDAEPFVSFGRYAIDFLPQVVLIDKKGELRYFQTEGRLLESIKALRRR